LDKVAKIINSK